MNARKLKLGGRVGWVAVPPTDSLFGRLFPRVILSGAAGCSFIRVANARRAAEGSWLDFHRSRTDGIHPGSHAARFM
jgi:hypothetical protein